MGYAYGKNVDFNIEYPLRAIISGSSQTGKSYFIQKLLNQNLCKNIRNIYYFGDKKHEKYKSYIGLPENTDFAKHSCVIIDNLYEKAIRSRAVYELFKYSGDRKVSIFLTTQNLSTPGKYSSSIHNNCNYLVLFSNTNRILNREFAHSRELDIPYKAAFDHVKDKSNTPIIINQSQQSKNLLLLTYISDRKVEAFDENGKLLYLFSKEELERYFEIVHTGDEHFYAINNENPTEATESAF